MQKRSEGIIPKQVILKHYIKQKENNMKKLILAMVAMFALCSFAQEAGKPKPVPAEPMARPTVEQQVEKAFADFDKDKDGKLDKAEATEMIKSRQGRMGGGMGRGQGGQGGQGRGQGGMKAAPPMGE